MKIRYAAAVALVGWTLIIRDVGGTCPKGTDCFQFDGRAEFMSGFKTREECEKAADDWLREFYAEAKKNGETVVAAPAKPQCQKDKPN